MILYGIPNCDTVKKARAWLDAQGVAYVFHDYKKAGISAAKLAEWLEQVPWERLLNRAGTTYRQVPEAARPGDAAGATALMLEKPSVIRRPLVEAGGRVHTLGFNEADYARLFAPPA